MKLNTARIRALIPTWVTDSELERIRNEFDPPLNKALLSGTMCNSNNWKRIYKEKHNPGIVRAFDCRPLDDQLRLYVLTDLKDEKVVEHYFQTE